MTKLTARKHDQLPLLDEYLSFPGRLRGQHDERVQEVIAYCEAFWAQSAGG
jgi:hypothetical protein